jgi:hypothetical protein
MRPQHLLDHAEMLCRLSPRRPRQVDLRRAVSAAYYAVFHELCHVCANTLVGTGAASATEAWSLAYRSVNHGVAKRRCRALPNQAFPPGIRNFAKTFVTLQEERHRADYDPTARFSRSSALRLVGNARRAVAFMGATPRSVRLAFAAHILFEPR